MTYSGIFLIGIFASFSTCMAVLGGIVLSLSATYAERGQKIRPQFMFHIGRLASFFIFGGIIGVIGSAFTLSPLVSFVLSFATALVMLVLGINLLDVFPWMEKLQVYMPDVIARKARAVMNWNHAGTPFIVGIVTFFLPCGFTQSMQVYALSTGSFFSGALTMLVFALGTLPALILLGMGAFVIHDRSKLKIFLQIAGVVVIVFAFFTMVNSLVAFGVIPPLFSTKVSTSFDNVSMVDGIQVIRIRASGGYSPSKSVAKAGIPTVIRFDTSGTFDCSSSIRIPSLGISKILPQSGSTDINIGTRSTGTLNGMCGMGMYPFNIKFE